MGDLFDSFTDVLAIIFIFGLPVIAVVMAFITAMYKKKREKEIRQLIIENKTDPETAKLLIDEPKKQKRKMGPFNLDTLRTASILLGIGLGALINWVLENLGLQVSTIYFWLLIAFGIGVGMLCSFLVEMRLFKKYGENKQTETTVED